MLFNMRGRVGDLGRHDGALLVENGMMGGATQRSGTDVEAG
jgi:hypothetical protein